MKSVLISIRPAWCGKIAEGKKTVEVRKTCPKLQTPFRCYIYCTKDYKMQFWRGRVYSYADDHSHNAFDRCGNGKIIGEFVCDRIVDWPDEIAPPVPLKDCCMTYSEVRHYGGTTETLFLWHISNLQIYDVPKELNDFHRTRAPQSWCYVEDIC